MKKLVAIAAAGAVSLLAAGPVGAGEPTSQMTATPDPAYVGDTVTVSNVDDESSTCDPIYLAEETSAGPAIPTVFPSNVEVKVEDPDGDVVFDDEVEADLDGNWAVEIPAEKVGTYLAEAYCAPGVIFAVDAAPAREPGFSYADIEWEVIAQPPSSPTTQASTTTTSQAVRAEALSRPRFTG